MALDLDEFPTDLWGMPGSAGTARHLADPTLRGLRRPWVGWLRRCLVLVLVLYSATTIPGVRSGGYNALIDGWVQNGVLVGACLLVFVRVSLERSCRLAWASIGTGVGLYAIGNIIYFAYVQYLDAVSYPSVADLPWLGSYLFLYLGLVGLARRRVQASEGTLWLDGLVSTLGIGAVASIGLNVVLHSTPGSVAAVVTTMAYPVGDLLLLMLIVATSGLLGWRPDRAWTLLGVGVVLFASADTIYVLRVATGSYQAGTLLDPLWAIAAVVIAAAALRGPPGEKAPAPNRRWAVLVIPSLFTLSSLAVLVYGSVRGVPLLATALATSAVLAAVTRAALTFREVQQLAVTRIEARTDELTGLGNRRQFHEVVQDRIGHLVPGERLAVLLLDLDRFKEVNDALGHSVGDTLLFEVGRRLTRGIRREDLVVRLSGDEFAIMLQSASREDALETAERLRRDLQASFTVEHVVIHVDASIGIAMCPDAGTTVAALLQRADIAMYGAKLDRIGGLVYEVGDNDDLTTRLRLIHELRAAIDEGQLVLHYQPKLDLRTGEIDGTEALVRWNHPQHGLLFPDKFIGEAERYGFMRRLTAAVLAMALDQAQAWHQIGIDTTIAVNVSASNLLDTELPEQIRSMLEVRALSADSLMVEITETTLMMDPTRSLHVLHELHELGVRISVDDYGTGYSSLGRLRDLPVSELKLDRSFVAGLHSDARSTAIVESTIQLAHALGLILVAEGIETPQQAMLLTRLGCDIGQGYHLGRPVPADELTSRLRSTSAVMSVI